MDVKRGEMQEEVLQKGGLMRKGWDFPRIETVSKLSVTIFFSGYPTLPGCRLGVSFAKRGTSRMASPESCFLPENSDHKTRAASQEQKPEG